MSPWYVKKHLMYMKEAWIYPVYRKLDLDVSFLQGKMIKRTRSVSTEEYKHQVCFNWATRQEDILGEWRYSSTHSWPPNYMDVCGYVYAPAALPPRERAAGTHWIQGWMGPRAGLDAVVKRKIPSPCQESNPRSSSPQPSAVTLSYPGS
jgi:rubredoxin